MNTPDLIAPPFRRPAGLTLLALLSNGIGLLIVLTALLGARSEAHLGSGETVLAALAAACGFCAVVASIWLLRLSPDGRSLLILACVLWLIVAGVSLAWPGRQSAGWIAALLGFGSLPAALALLHLTRDRIGELFRTAPRLRGGRGIVVFDAVVFVLAVLLFEGSINMHDDASAPAREPREALERATALYRESKYIEAIPLYREYLRTNPDDALSHARLGYSLIQLERWNEAAVTLKREIELEPDSYMGHNNLALVYEKLDALDAGLVAAREAVRLRPDDPTTRNTLGLILLRSGEYSEAIEHLQTALRLDPSLAVARLNLGLARARSGQMDRARAELASLDRIDPESAAVLRAEIENLSRNAAPKR